MGIRTGVSLEDFLDQARPSAAGFPGTIRMVPIGNGSRRQARAFSLFGRGRNPPAIGIGPVKSLTMASRIGDMGCDAVDPLHWIQLDGGRALSRRHG